MAGGSAVKASGVCPATVDWIAGPAPPNGTCTRSRPNFSLNNSPDRWGVEPIPGPAKLYLPGLALISAISSLISFAGTEGWVTSTFGDAATRVTAAKSFTGSYGIFAYRLALTRKP